MKRSWPYVYFWRGNWWCDTGKKFGSRKRKKFLTEDEAKEQADNWRTEQKKGGNVANLSDQQRLDAVMGIRLMEEHGVKETLFDAVRYFVERKYPKGGDITVQEAVDAFIAEKERKKKSSVYIYSLNRLQRLVEAFGTQKLSRLTGDELMAHIETAKSKKGKGTLWSAETQRQHFRYYNMFFLWCIRHHHLKLNPFAEPGIESPIGNEDPPGTLLPSEIQILLDAAWEMVQTAYSNGGDQLSIKDSWAVKGCDWRFYPYLVLGIFYGIRPWEISRLQWRHISSNCDWVRCTHEVSKTRDTRNVPSTANGKIMLKEYLKLVSPSEVPHEFQNVLPGYFDRFKIKFREWRRTLIGNRWEHDAMRHTYASYFHAYSLNNVSELMNRMGHSQSKTTLDNYTSFLVEIEESEAFWTILPKGLSMPTLPTDEKERRSLLLNL